MEFGYACISYMYYAHIASSCTIILRNNKNWVEYPETEVSFSQFGLLMIRTKSFIHMNWLRSILLLDLLRPIHMRGTSTQHCPEPWQHPFLWRSWALFWIDVPARSSSHALPSCCCTPFCLTRNFASLSMSSLCSTLLLPLLAIGCEYRLPTYFAFPSTWITCN